MANASFPVNALKFWLVFPLTGMPVGKARRPSPTICVTLGWWDPTLPPVCPTASSATPHRPLAPLQGCRASWISIPTPTATEGHHFNQGSGTSDGKMLPSQIGCSIVSWETALRQAAGGAGADGFEYSPFCFWNIWERNKELNNGSPSGWGKLFFLFPTIFFIYERGLAKVTAFWTAAVILRGKILWKLWKNWKIHSFIRKYELKGLPGFQYNWHKFVKDMKNRKRGSLLWSSAWKKEIFRSSDF